MNRAYFAREEGAPAPLRVTVERQVRFEEVDPLNIVWHGRYPSYFEDARVALGARYGIGYLDFHRHGILTPIKKMHADYHLPLRFPDLFSVEAILHWTEGARLDYQFIIRNEAGQVATTGYTVQMMVDLEYNIMLLPPPFLRHFLDDWKEGSLQGSLITGDVKR